MSTAPIVRVFPALQLAPALLTFPFVFFLLAAFFQRKDGFELRTLSKILDRQFGPGGTKNFMKRLRPITLFMCALLTLGVSGLITTHLTSKAPSSYVMSGFFLSGGAGLLSAYLLSIRYPPHLN